MNMDTKRKDEIEMILMIGAMALMGAIGIIALIALICGLLGMDVYDVGIKNLAWMMVGLTGFLFGGISLARILDGKK
ncbi:MAG: hypothetical protein II250_03395 [Agathobacter sp.]|nr:hypothetical protein [Agathobacter sp.]